mmetsp:Transcript_159567/g.281703  ORF Transcript_159567/g.281703 Transcript_159567/m.281703 type:complete len:363 (+) Transcript_159567:94-1182(+)
MLRRVLDHASGLHSLWHHCGQSELCATARNAGNAAAAFARRGRETCMRSSSGRGAAGILLAAGAAGGSMASFCENRDEGSSDQVTNWALYSDMSALWRREWDKDWDGRAPPAAKDGQEKVKTQGRHRHLLFVRHGQYELDDKEHGLTDLGREQSRLLGERFAKMAKGVQRDKYGELRIKYEGIWSSDVKRAMETADIISECLPSVPRLPPDSILAEGPPTVPHPSKSREGQGKRADLWENSARIEAAFRRYVHRDVDHKKVAEKEKREKIKLSESYHPEAEVSNQKDDSKEEAQHSWEIIVCHGNVIRYFVMRTLQLPPEAWLRLRGDNCGITELIIRPNGSVTLARFADTGHLPIEMQTFH